MRELSLKDDQIYLGKEMRYRDVEVRGDCRVVFIFGIWFFSFIVVILVYCFFLQLVLNLKEENILLKQEKEVFNYFIVEQVKEMIGKVYCGFNLLYFD